jgi:hypothetical protein
MNVRLIILPSMRRPASGCSSGSLTGTVTLEAIGVNEKDMKLARPGRHERAQPGRKERSWWSRPPVDPFLHVAVMVFP